MPAFCAPALTCVRSDVIYRDALRGLQDKIVGRPGSPAPITVELLREGTLTKEWVMVESWGMVNEEYR